MYTDLNKELTDEQKMLKQRMHEFAAQVLRPAAWELDKMTPEETIAPGSRMRDVFRIAYEQEFHLRGFPEALGGAHLGPLESHIVNEEMGWGASDFCDRAQRHVVPVLVRVEPPGPADDEGSRDAVRRTTARASTSAAGRSPSPATAPTR